MARAGAALFIKDLHRPASRAELERLVEMYAAACNEYQRRTFFESLHAGLTVSEIKSICERLALSGVEVGRCSDRHWSLERRATLEAPSEATWQGPRS